MQNFESNDKARAKFSGTSSVSVQFEADFI